MTCEVHGWPINESMVCSRSIGIVSVSQCNNCLSLRIVFLDNQGATEERIVEPTGRSAAVDSQFEAIVSN